MAPNGGDEERSGCGFGAEKGVAVPTEGAGDGSDRDFDRHGKGVAREWSCRGVKRGTDSSSAHGDHNFCCSSPLPSFIGHTPLNVLEGTA